MRANIGGTLLASIDLTAVVVLAAAAVSGTMPRRGWLVAVTWALIATLVVAVAEWAWRYA